MNRELRPHHFELDEARSRVIEDALWSKAESLSQTRQSIVSEQSALYAQIQEMRKRGANLHEETLLSEMESTYRQNEQAIWAIQSLESETQIFLEKLSAKNLTYEEAEEIVPTAGSTSQATLSKRRSAIQKQNERYKKLLLSRGVKNEDIIFYPDLFSLDYSAGPKHVPGGPNETKLTTGRHQKRIKTGSVELNEFNAGNEFYYRTADTHGGKVGFGKRGDRYVSNSGKKIRKF